MDKILKAPFIDRVDEWPHVRVVRLKGPIDKEVIPQMDRLKDEILRHGRFERKNIIFDVARVTAFDSATVAALILWMRELQEDHHRMGFIHVSEDMIDLAELFNVEDRFKVYESEEQAIAAMNQP